MSDVVSASAKSIARAIRDKRVSSHEVVQAHLDRIDQVNGKLNAVVYMCAERALAEARDADVALSRGDKVGPLHGVPMTLKDSLDTEGVVTTYGTTGRVNFVPKRDAALVTRLRSAGAILLGKTNTPEITWSGQTLNKVYGRTNNPFDLERNPGGSSGGAAAIVSACGSPFDIGSDTGGSIRMPAHFCGVAGIKPTSGRVPRTGHIIGYTMGAMDSFTQNGPIARYIEDLALILPVISGADWEDPAIVDMPLISPDEVEINGLRVAYYTHPPGFAPPDLDTQVTTLKAVLALAEAGAKITEDAPDALKQVVELEDKVSEGHGGEGALRILERAGTVELSLQIETWLKEATSIPVEEFTEALEELGRFRSTMLGYMRDYDVIICPTAAYPARLHDYYQSKRSDSVPLYTHLFNLTGWPVAVVRCGASSEGLPIGVQVAARPWREDVALAVSAFLESALGGWQKPPI